MTSDPLVLLLSEYRAADDRESGYRTRMLDLARSERRFDRQSYDPGHFTASAFVLSPDRTAVALILHKKLKLWLQPGGHIESFDATVLAAAEREVREELGLDAFTIAPEAPGLFDVDIHAIPARPGEPAHEHFDLRFAFVAETRTTSPNDEVAGAEWVELTALDSAATDESVRRAVRKLRVAIAGRDPARGAARP